MMEANTSKMIMLSGSNYSSWKSRMEDLLYVKSYYLPVFSTEKPDDKTDEQWTIFHRQVCGFIRQWVEDNVLNHVIGINHARTLWSKLEELYASNTGSNKMLVMNQLLGLKYKDDTSMADHVNVFQGYINQLSSMGLNFEDELLGLWLFGSLPHTWDTFRTSVSNSAPRGVVTYDLAKASCMNEEMRRKSFNSGSSSKSDILVTESRGRSHSRGPKNKVGRSKSRGKFANVECHHCGKKGHIKPFCRLLKKENMKKYKEKNKEKKTDDSSDEERVATATEDFLIVYDSDVINLANHETSWVIDSGASTHATSRKDFFTSYTPGRFGFVKMGNDGEAEVVGIGDVCLETSNGSKLILKDVKHIPDIRLNLISTGKLDDDGYCNTFVNGQWKLTKGSMIVARGKRLSALYMLQAKISNHAVNVVENVAISELWHKRLAHISEKGLTLLGKKNALSGLKSVDLQKCAHCLAGKQNRVSFKSSTPSKKENLLDLVHSDLCGPMKIQTLGGSLYFVTFIDDHSRKTWAYTLKHKSQVLDVFKQFHASVERETGRKLKCIRSDNGGEYSGPFDEYCAQQGIRHQKTPPKTPQLNGLAERMNRTLVERVRCLLSQAKLPKSFWGEALSTAVHILNLTPCVPLQFDVPNRVWTGKDVSYDYLRVFGCKTFLHIPKDERTKLDVKTKQCVFVGYGHDEFGYRFYDPIHKKLVRSRDAVFMEDETIEDIDKLKAPLHRPEKENIDMSIVPPAEVQNDEHDTIETDDSVPEQPLTTEGPDPIPLRRSSRNRQPSTRYPVNEYILLTDGGEPECFEEAMESEQKREWIDAMDDEMKSLHENHTYELVKLPKGKRALKNRWIYRVKQEHNSRLRYKARLVVKGFSQRKGVDFDEIFSPVVKMSSIRVVMGLAASLDLEIEQMDVKTAFLHGDLQEEIYMEQPEGFTAKGKEEYVCKLNKSLYGLKQAPRQWYMKFESVMGEQGYIKTNTDHCVFFKRFGDDDFIILLLYVDDMLVVGRNMSRINQLKKQLSTSFDMKDLGPAEQILAMRIVRRREERKIFLSQEKYILKVLQRFKTENAKVVSSPLPPGVKLSREQCPSTCEKKEYMQKVPYSSAVGSLMYAMICTRPDIAHAVSVVSRFLSNPGKEHWNAVKWIMRYLRGTSNFGLCFGSDTPELVGYADADMAGDIDTRKSTSGYLITFAGGAVSWQSRLQKCVALSTTEAEFIAATEGCKELLWMKNFLKELGFNQDRYVLFCDNQSAIYLAKNSTFHAKSKHIDMRYHWIRDVVNSKLVYLEKIHTDDNGSDMLTKALSREKIVACRRVAGITASSST